MMSTIVSLNNLVKLRYVRARLLSSLSSSSSSPLPITEGTATVPAAPAIVPSYTLTYSNLHDEVVNLSRFISSKKNLYAITGAGVSTGSGIPDYRSEKGSYNMGHKPMKHQEFISTETDYHRKRYWSRSMLGYRAFQRAQPNPTHYGLARLERNGFLKGIITQNVDRLHQRAGSILVDDLHGRADKCECLQCSTQMSRRMVQQKIEELNPELAAIIKQIEIDVNDRETQILRADGDAEISSHIDYSTFTIYQCPKCSGVLKPTVTYFGDNVKLSLVTEIYNKIDTADGLLVIGTSLEVYSAYRFIVRASERGIPIAIINRGETRADRGGTKHTHNIVFRSDTDCSLLLSGVMEHLKL